jgi:FixJ family two-component response regulator
MEHWKARDSVHDVPSYTISMYQPRPDSDEVKAVVGMDDRGMSAHQMFEDLQRRHIWRRLGEILAPRQKQILDLILQEHTTPQIARELKVSLSTIKQTRMVIVRKAQQLFDIEERKAA